MGMKNMRAICPNCGGKIHTQPKGFLGAIAIGANGPLTKTGTTCEHCGVKLTGKVTATNYAVLAPEAVVPPTPIKRNPTPQPPAVGREEYLRRRDG